jgi:predicted membrane-bound spermidine synthase
MASRLDLHSELISLCPNVYFQPPSSIAMMYPCIVYDMTNRLHLYASDVIHVTKQQYRITVIDKNPDSDIANQVEQNLQYCGIDQYYTVDNLNHTVLSLYY